MSAKHTPGEWKYGRRADGSIWMSLGDFETGPHYQFDWMAGEANARLIAAAPDLLAACNDALDWINELLPAHASGGDRFSAIREAIAKAEGRT